MKTLHAALALYARTPEEYGYGGNLITGTVMQLCFCAQLVMLAADVCLPSLSADARGEQTLPCVIKKKK